MGHDAAAQTVRTTLAQLGLAETALGAVDATVGLDPSRRTAEPADPAPLPTLELAATPAASSELLKRGELGRGGMGVVHLAVQRALGREVAVKVATSGAPEVVRALVREARVMGALEHPNVVPVHLLGLSPEGAPLLVMKRVEGVSWQLLLREPENAAWATLLAGHGDRLRAHVDILVQLCRALAFAHERGVVHRDLKPENVMVGRFGEVLLLDWGIALRLSERDSEPRGIVGTPGYLAPEMVSADPRLVDARTDVYLLGATLFEVLTGRMPHDAPDAIGALTMALVGERPPYPSSAPRELVELCESAMALDPSRRPASVESFRQGLVHFLASREAEVVAAEARGALERARSAAVAGGHASAAVLRALTEARFGLGAALKVRPKDEGLQGSLQEVLLAMIDRELALQSPASARELLAELSSPSPEAAARIDALERELARKREAELAQEAHRRESESRVAVGPLVLLGVLLVLVGEGIGWWYFFRSRSSAEGYPRAAAIANDLLVVVLELAGLLVFRARLFATAGTRRLTLAWVLWTWSIALSDLVSYSTGASVAVAGMHSFCVSGFVAAAFALIELPTLWLCAAGHALAVALISRWPGASSGIVMVFLLADTVWFYLAFKRHGARSAPEAPSPYSGEKA